MNSLYSLAQELKIPNSFLENYKTYVGITSKSMDKQLARSASNVFASRIISHADNNIYNDYNTAYAVAQNIELFQIITSLIQQPSENLQWGIQLLKYTIFQLDKKKPMTYLNQLMANKTLPNQPIQQGVEFSKIYSFVHLCGFAQLLKPLQSELPITHLLGAEQINAFDFHLVDSSLPVLFQIDKAQPILVLIKPDIGEIQKIVFQNHLNFLKEISIQLLFDATSQNKKISFFSECLKFQPYRFQKIEQLAAQIFEGQYNYQDRCVQFLQIPNIKKTLGFLIDPQFNIDFVIKQLMENTETTVAQEKIDGSLQQAEPDINVFQTQVQQLSIKLIFRRTLFH